jgi:hypothetical protein
MSVQATEHERIHASILKSRTLIDEAQCHVHEALCDLHETVLRSREAISHSLDVIARADEALVGRSSARADAISQPELPTRVAA